MAEQTRVEAPLTEAVEADLREGGALSRALPGYEQRPAQVDMARRVALALDSGEHLIVEAATGTGKSLAYLLPIVRSGKVALISTANKNLQEQLFYKDIPFVQQHVLPFEAALVKGMGNYLCLDRLQEEEGFQQFVKERDFTAMLDQMDDDSGWDGDLDLLRVPLKPEVRSHVAADGEQCAWRGCPHFGQCYVRKMRDRSRDAQVIVVNHTLLLLDAAMDGWLLPERDVIVVDEAHHLEEEATRAFTVTVSEGRVASLLAQKRLRSHVNPDVLSNAAERTVRAWDALRLAVRLDARGRQQLTRPLEEGLSLATAIEALAGSLRIERPDNQDDKESKLYDKLINRASGLAADLRLVFGEQRTDERVYYVEQLGGRGRRTQQLSVSAAPLDVTELLREKLFDKISTIATSATLAVNQDFRFFRRRVGLTDAREAVLPLTFDYRENALLYVPRMRLEPAFGAASEPYLDELAEEMRRLVEASRGRAFLLFSSQNALRGVYERLNRGLEDDGFWPIYQGPHISRIEMLRQFRDHERDQAVLFGLKSFWEGVDVAGEALSLVAIDKLPFDPPDDPVNEARITKMKERGENWFGDYVLPLAILRLKQGIGRLLRTRDDRGVMAVLDKRLHTKGYGRQVLDALPPARRASDIAQVRAFFADD